MHAPHHRIALATVSGVTLAILLCVSLEHPAAQGEARPEIPVGLDLYLPVPEDNPLRPERVALGRRLFFDPVLSRDRSLACAGCHEPDRAFTDGRALSVGVFGRVGTRSVPTIVNRAYGRSFFWDGRTWPDVESRGTSAPTHPGSEGTGHADQGCGRQAQTGPRVF